MKAKLLTYLTFFLNTATILWSYRGKLGNMREIWYAVAFFLFIASIGVVGGHNDARQDCVNRCKPRVAISYSVLHCECDNGPISCE